MIRLIRFGILMSLGFGIALAPRLAAAAAPCPPGTPGCVSIATMPQPSGIMPAPEEFSVSQDTIYFSGAAIDTVGGFQLQVDPTAATHPTFTRLIFHTDYTPGIGLMPDLGSLYSQFPIPWAATAIPGGVELDWQPGAPKLGQAYLDNNGRTHYAALQLEIDPGTSTTTDFTAFDRAIFSVQATPEPGLMALGAGLLGSGGLLLRRARRRRSR